MRKYQGIFSDSQVSDGSVIVSRMYDGRKVIHGRAMSYSFRRVVVVPYAYDLP